LTEVDKFTYLGSIVVEHVVLPGTESWNFKAGDIIKLEAEAFELKTDIAY